MWAGGGSSFPQGVHSGLDRLSCVPRAAHSSELLCPSAAQLAAVHLVDSHYCTDPGKFISVLCTSLSTMLHVELPHVNVLSKMDLIEHYGKLGEELLSHSLLWGGRHLSPHLLCLPSAGQGGSGLISGLAYGGIGGAGEWNWGARCKSAV